MAGVHIPAQIRSQPHGGSTKVYLLYTYTMALNIKNREVERLVTELAEITGESKTEAIRRALAERRSRLALHVAVRTHDDLVEVLEREIWSKVPKRLRGKRLTRRAWERIVGYGPEGA